MFDKILAFGGWPGLVLLLGGNLFGMTAWLACVAAGRYRFALFVSIVIFPFTFYAGRAAGIRAFSVPDFDQFLGLSTLLLLSLFVILLVTGRVRRPRGTIARSIELTLWAFAIALTASQIATHTPLEALLLSIGAAWQFVALFYLLTSLIVRERDLFGLLNAMFLFSVLNIVVRVVAKGESFFVSLSSPTAGDSSTFGADVGRVGSGALGPAMSYAGYLAMFITLALGVYFVTRKAVYLAYIAVMLMELLNTFTRGGLFVLFLLALLLVFRRTRPATLKLILPLVGLLAVSWPIIGAYVVFRGFSFDVMNLGNFSLRVELTRLFLSDYRFNWWGNGILRLTMFELRSWLIVPIHNAYLEVLDECGPLVFGLFVLLSILVVIAAIRACRQSRAGNICDRALAGLAPFVLIALLQWIVYANTTSTSILAYYPYEGTAVFWTVAIAPVLLLSIRRTAVLAVARSPRRMAAVRVGELRPAVPPQWQPSLPAGRSFSSHD